jgi:hypothetical protein
MKITHLTADDLESLINFSKKTFGDEEYQSSREYIEWLYTQNPYSEGYSDCLIAKNELDEVVGCIHKMRLPLSSKTHLDTIASLQNLMVDEFHRAGLGILMLKKSFLNEKFIIAPGVSGDLKKAYRIYQFRELNGYWGRKILSPALLFLNFIESKILGKYFNLKKLNSAKDAGIKFIIEPTNDDLLDLKSIIKIYDPNHSHHNWDINLIRWRYFSPTGPKHILVKSENSSSAMLISYGHRKNLKVARIIEAFGGANINLIRNLMTGLKKAGISVLLAYTTSDKNSEIFKACGLLPVTPSPSTFTGGVDHVKHQTIDISAGLTDIGFESINSLSCEN